MEADAERVSRTPALIARSSEALVAVGVQISGTATFVQDGRRVQVHLRQGQAVDVLQSGQRPPAGDRHQAPPAPGQQRTDLRLVAGVVQHDQAPAVAQQGAQQPGAAPRVLLRQPAVRHAEGLQQRLFRVHGAFHPVQVDHEAPVGEHRPQIRCHLQRQRRLPASRRARDERHRRSQTGAGAFRSLPQQGQLRFTSREVLHGSRRHRRPRHRDRARGSRRPAHGQQRLPLRVREAEPLRQRHGRAPLRNPAAAPLHVADRPDAHARRLGQLLDGQTASLPQITQNGTERLLPVHDSWFLPPRGKNTVFRSGQNRRETALSAPTALSGPFRREGPTGLFVPASGLSGRSTGPPPGSVRPRPSAGPA